jgi:hypothetical protein
VNEDLRAGTSERDRAGETDAARRPGDERGFS